MQDYYSVLGISRTASQDDVRKAFIGLAKKSHPDIQPKVGDWRLANDMFASIAVAYNTLIDREKRIDYDQKLATGFAHMDGTRKNHARTTFKLGVQCFKSGYHRRGYHYFKACCKLDPENPQYWSHLGLSAIYSGCSLEEAVMYGKKAIELQPSSAQYHINLGIIYKRGGKQSDGKREFKTALKLDKNNLQAKEFLKS